MNKATTNDVEKKLRKKLTRWHLYALTCGGWVGKEKKFREKNPSQEPFATNKVAAAK